MAHFPFVVGLLLSASAHADPNVVTSLASKVASGLKSVFHTSKDQPTIFRDMYIPYDALSARQRELLGTLQKARGFEGSNEDFWYELGRRRTVDGMVEFANSTQRTFFANTAALAHRYAKDGTPAIDLVESITEVHGGFVDGPSNEQYNVAVVWKKPKAPMKSIKEMFQDGRKKCKKHEPNCTSWYNRPSVYHPGESGVQETRGGYSGLHLLFDKDSDQGHVTIAFRKTNLFESILTTLHLGFLVPSALKKGHFSPQDADIGAIGPEKEHGRPIDNLRLFARLYGYDYKTLKSYSEDARVGERSWSEDQLAYDNVPAPALFDGPIKNLPAESVNVMAQTASAGQAI